MSLAEALVAIFSIRKKARNMDRGDLGNGGGRSDY